MKAFILYNLYWFTVHIQKSCELTLCQSDDLMRLMLPLAKLAFQYTQEVPARVTKYCQLMNRPCTASSAVNLSQLLLLLKKPHKIKTLKTLCFLSLRAKICFLFSGANSLLTAQQLAWVTSRELHGKEFFLPVDDNPSTRGSALPQCVLCFGDRFGQGPTSSKFPCLRPSRAFPI